MSGHSKWSKIKRSKGVADAKRGQIFTKLGREVSVAVREGGSDPESNFRLRLAIQKCRENNMPMDNVNSAIKRASGAAGGGGVSLDAATSGAIALPNNAEVYFFCQGNRVVFNRSVFQ